MWPDNTRDLIKRWDNKDNYFSNSEAWYHNEIEYVLAGVGALVLLTMFSTCLFVPKRIDAKDVNDSGVNVSMRTPLVNRPSTPVADRQRSYIAEKYGRRHADDDEEEA